MKIPLFVRTPLLCLLFAVFAPMDVQAQAPAAAPDTTSEKTTIEIAALPIDTGEAQYVSAQIAAFAEAHPEIVPKTLGQLQGSQKDPINELPYMAENIVVIDSIMGGEVPFLVERGELVPIDELLSGSDTLLEGIEPNLLESVRYRGKTWGVPLRSVEGGLVCDWSLFEAAGISQPPSTWAEFADDAKRLTKDSNGDGTIDQVGLMVGKNHLSLIFFSIALQNGFTVVGNSGFNVDSPIAQEAYEFLRELYAAGAIQERTTTVKPAMQIRTSEEIVKSLSDDEFRARCRLAQFPTNGKPVFFSSRRVYLSIRKSTPEKEAASWELLQWLLRNDAPLPPALGLAPPRPNTVDRPDFKEWAEKFCPGVESIVAKYGWMVDSAPHLGKKRDGLGNFRNILNDGLMQNKPAHVVLPAAAKQANARIQAFVEPNRSTFDIYK